MERKLERNPQNQMIAGVASGLADYLLIDVTLVRVMFILLAVFGFSGVIIYIILWIVVPEKPFFRNVSDFDTDYKVNEETSGMYTQRPEAILPETKPKSDTGRVVAGLVLIIVGAWFLLAEFNIIPHWFSLFKLWPLVIIALGMIILLKSGKRSDSNLNANKPPVMNWDDKPQPQDEGNIKKDDQPLS